MVPGGLTGQMELEGMLSSCMSTVEEASFLKVDIESTD